MTRSGTKKQVAFSAGKKRKSINRSHGQKPKHYLNPSMLRSICRLPPKHKHSNENAKYWYRNPKFRRVEDPDYASACNVCKEVHPPRLPNEPMETQSEASCSSSGSSCSSISTQLFIPIESKQSNRMSSEEYCQESCQELLSDVKLGGRQDAIGSSSQQAGIDEDYWAKWRAQHGFRRGLAAKRPRIIKPPRPL